MDSGCHLGLSGRVRVEVLDQGNPIFRSEWQKNLLLDRGMNMLADISIENLFRVCGKGTGTDETNVDLDVSDVYAQSGSTLTRTSGTRDFSAADIGRRFRVSTSPNQEGTILDVTGVPDFTTAEISNTQSFTGKNISLWFVEQTGLSLETGVMLAGANLVSKTLGSGIVLASTIFDAGIIAGTAIYFPSQDRAFLVATRNSDTSITITLTGDDFEASSEADTIAYIPSTTGELVSQSRSNVYSGASGENGTSWSGEVVGVGAHPDNIKLLTRTFVFDPEPSDTTINELIFSESTVPAANANIRIKLTSGIVVLGPAGVNPGQQLKVTYQFFITFPTAASAANVLCPITDTGGTSGSKLGQYAIEGPQVSGVDTDGDPVLIDPVLDPYYPPQVAYSTDFAALAPLAFPVRPAVYTTDTEKDGAYTAGSFEQTFVAVFGVNEAINTNLRTLMLYIPTSGRPAFTFRFNSNQVKDGNHSLTVRFTKTWSRELSP